MPKVFSITWMTGTTALVVTGSREDLFHSPLHCILHGSHRIRCSISPFPWSRKQHHGSAFVQHVLAQTFTIACNPGIVNDERIVDAILGIGLCLPAYWQ